jgi:hypothetical protein
MEVNRLEDLRLDGEYWVLNSKKLRWAGDVARIGEKGCIQGFDGKTWGKNTTWKTQA